MPETGRIPTQVPFFLNMFCGCQEKKNASSAEPSDGAARRDSSFPSSSAFFLSVVMMTNRPPLSSNRTFRDDGCPLRSRRRSVTTGGSGCRADWRTDATAPVGSTPGLRSSAANGGLWCPKLLFFFLSGKQRFGTAFPLRGDWLRFQETVGSN